jgi:oligoendopeptidase F
MRRIALGVAGVMLTIAGMSAQAPRTRETTPDQYKWNLAEIFATDEAWQAEKTRLSQEFAKARDFKGTLSSRPTPASRRTRIRAIRPTRA